MSLITGYLTPRQKLIWDLKRKGFSEVGVARELKVTRQTIHKALDSANSKVCMALEEAAKINKIRVKLVDPARGILAGYSPNFKTEVLITFSAKNGVQVWYEHEGDCKNCDQLQVCKEFLISEAKERNIKLPESANSLSPSKLAELLFLSIMSE